MRGVGSSLALRPASLQQTEGSPRCVSFSSFSSSYLPVVVLIAFLKDLVPRGIIDLSDSKELGRGRTREGREEDEEREGKTEQKE